MSWNDSFHINTVSKGIPFTLKSKQALMLFNISGQGEVSSLDIKIPSKGSILYFIIDEYDYNYKGSTTTYQNVHFVKELPTQPTYVYFIGDNTGKVDLTSYSKTSPNGIYTFGLNRSQAYLNTGNIATDKEVFICGSIKFNKNFTAFIISNDTVDTTIQYYYVINMFKQP